MLEIIGFVVSLAYVWLLIREQRAGWVLCILSGLLYILIYAQAKLYSDAELQLLYIAIGVYGYYSWNSRKEDEVPVINRATNPVFIRCILVVLLMTLLWGGLHSRFTDASYPYIDALLCSTCIVAQWMMVRKYFQCWYLWIFAGIGYIWMYATKELLTTTVLYAIYSALNIKGYKDWKRAIYAHTCFSNDR